ncbi:MAG: secretin and TonB N-terminal domain-containing protein [bacterium]
MKTSHMCSWTSRVVTLIFGWCLAWGGSAGLVFAAGSVDAPASAADSAAVPMSEKVTINVDDGLLTQVLNAFSRQTGRSIVVGPEVTGKVTARLSDIPWRDALDSILKPYGYGYYLVGDTIIVSSLDKIEKIAKATAGPTNITMSAGSVPAAPPPPEPLVVKVLTLKYVDASDVMALIEQQLTPGRGTVSRMAIQSQTWLGDSGMNARAGGGGNSAETLGRLKRVSEEKGLTKGKSLIVVDTKAVIDRIEDTLRQIDVMPTQIQIEAKFVEVRADLLRDIGVEWGSGPNGATPGGAQNIGFVQKSKLYAAGGQQISGGVTPSAFLPQSSGLSGRTPTGAGLSFAFQKLTDLQFDLLLHLMQEDTSYNVLSAPRILTMNNQDATIIVGSKFPIIKSDTTAGGAGGSTTSTSLEYYENIGIQLKVLPQVCENNFINLIVHPSVREMVGKESGKVGVNDTGAGASVSLTEYPLLDTREAETQVLLKSGQTLVIGGMLKDKKQSTQLKVPFLGSIPLLGVLFRRDTVSTEKTELLIFLTATIRPPNEEAGVKAPESVSDGKMTLHEEVAKSNSKNAK